jgi:large subunit ribosomal protein L32
MGLPTKKHAKTSKRVRRAVIKLLKVTLNKCPKCKKPIRPHTACKKCGAYKGREVIKIRIPKALRKKKVKSEKGKE